MKHRHQKKEEIEKKTREIILRNPLATFSTHKENLKKSNLAISIADSTLKNKIHAIKTEIYPLDDEFFSQISMCNLTLSNNETQMFFRCQQTFYNSDSKKVKENLIFFSDFQLKLLFEATEWDV